MVNVGKYSIHGAYGIGNVGRFQIGVFARWPTTTTHPEGTGGSGLEASTKNKLLMVQTLGKSREQ